MVPSWGEHWGAFGPAGSEGFETQREATQLGLAQARAGLSGANVGETLELWDRLNTEVWELVSTAYFNASLDGGNTEAGAVMQRARELVPALQLLEDELAAAAEGQDLARFGEHGPMLAEKLEQPSLPPGEAELEQLLRRESQQGWEELYRSYDTGLRASFRGQNMSMGALLSLIDAPEADVRREAHHARTQAFAGVRDQCALALTHLTGARQTRYDRMGTDALSDALIRNRLSRPALDAMWVAVREAEPLMHRYLRAKAKAMGNERLSVWDLRAALPGAREWSWAEAVHTIEEATTAVLPSLGKFVGRAVRGGWIDAAPRTGKNSGAYCGFLPMRGESRVFMSFTNSAVSTTCLAHELGHAYHNDVLRSQPMSRFRLVGSLAESASLLSENAVRAHMADRAANPEEERFALDQALMSVATILLDTPSRFRFEMATIDARKAGALSADDLDGLMAKELAETYCDSVVSLDEGFWRTKRHFYFSYQPLGNWIYTFGHLFSKLLLAHRAEDGFADRVQDVLLRTGFQSCDEIAREALGVELSEPDTWRRALAGLSADVARFEELTP